GGRRRCKGSETLSVRGARARDPPPVPRELNPEVPTALSDVVMQLLAKKPQERPASARFVVDALQSIDAGAGKAPPPDAPLAPTEVAVVEAPVLADNKSTPPPTRSHNDLAAIDPRGRSYAIHAPAKAIRRR